jgi:adenylate kinase
MSKLNLSIQENQCINQLFCLLMLQANVKKSLWKSNQILRKVCRKAQSNIKKRFTEKQSNTKQMSTEKQSTYYQQELPNQNLTNKCV